MPAEQRAAADRACRYLENNSPCFHYDKALDTGWPIASGIAEGAARHLVADRLDITGSRWTVPGAEAVLTLRALISNSEPRPAHLRTPGLTGDLTSEESRLAA
ncbi:hypothetical protein ACIHFB_27215 [Streptomyces sp. NPDC051963]|uniref:hypothetical protein n=1 Tax=Streptomyces sp. NPDC051963 TaxID=3365678 RepID=UPI0037D33B76